MVYEHRRTLLGDKKVLRYITNIKKKKNINEFPNKYVAWKLSRVYRACIHLFI
jgi:hypothetical protein